MTKPSAKKKVAAKKPIKKAVRKKPLSAIQTLEVKMWKMFELERVAVGAALSKVREALSGIPLRYEYESLAKRFDEDSKKNSEECLQIANAFNRSQSTIGDHSSRIIKQAGQLEAMEKHFDARVQAIEKLANLREVRVSAPTISACESSPVPLMETPGGKMYLEQLRSLRLKNDLMEIEVQQRRTQLPPV